MDEKEVMQEALRALEDNLEIKDMQFNDFSNNPMDVKFRNDIYFRVGWAISVLKEGLKNV